MRRRKFFALTADFGAVPFDLVLCVGDPRRAEKHLEKTYGIILEDIGVMASGQTHFLHSKDCYHVVVWLAEWRPSVLVHELFHAVSYVFDTVDIPKDESTEEVWAYTLQHLFAQLTGEHSRLKEKSNERSTST